MKNLARAVLLAFLCPAPGCTDEDSSPPPPIDSVQPFIGSGGVFSGVGSSFVGALVPFGMARPGPNTSSSGGDLFTDHYSGYAYKDDRILGFAQVHIHGTGAVDYGALLFQPTVGFSADKTDKNHYFAPFDKANEKVSPGAYEVTLDPDNIRVELTATRRAAFHRYTFGSPGARDRLLIHLSHAVVTCKVSAARVEVDPREREISGWLVYEGALTGRYGGVKLYFSARMDQPLEDWTVWRDGKLLPRATAEEGVDVGVALRLRSDAPVEVQVGLSYVDVQGARRNRETEIGDSSFAEVRAAARDAWDSALGRIEVRGGTPDQRTMFYTALYHVMFSPTLFSDVDGRYRGFDRAIHKADGFDFYSDITLWDTYRTANPLLLLVAPTVQRDLIRSLLEMAAQGGHLPRCPVGTGYGDCMISTPANTVIADSYLKGLRGFDAERAFAAMKTAATGDGMGRAGIESYLKLGYVPGDLLSGATARTLEYAIDDAAVGAMAGKLGKGADAKAFTERSKSYKNLWDKQTSFLRARKADGSWLADPFDPLAWEGAEGEFIEGSAWHYLWLVPHDPDGLAQLFGSKEAMISKLETFFTEPETNYIAKKLNYSTYYWHGNEPDIHAAYLFAQVGAPDRTQRWVRKVMEQSYGTGPDGLAGNDDCGTLSAWYVFSAMGFYPIPGQDRYVLGSPIFRASTIHLGDGETFRVVAPETSEQSLHITAATLDGKALDRPYLPHAALAGGVLELSMGPSPSKWGRGP